MEKKFLFFSLFNLYFFIEMITPLILETQTKNSYSHILATATSFGKVSDLSVSLLYFGEALYQSFKVFFGLTFLVTYNN